MITASQPGNSITKKTARTLAENRDDIDDDDVSTSLSIQQQPPVVA